MKFKLMNKIIKMMKLYGINKFINYQKFKILIK